MSEQSQDTAGDTDTDGAGQQDQTADSGQQQSQQDQTFTQADLDRIVEQRLTRERGKFKDYKDLQTKASKFDELERSQKTETERLTEDRDGYKTRAEQAEIAKWRLEVALDKGLTKSQAKRLVGDTREDLETDADELLEDLGGKSGGKTDDSKTEDSKTQTPVKDRPREQYRGGGNPSEEPEETDPQKLAALVPRAR